MQLPAKQTRVEAQLPILECTIRFGFPVVQRTDGRTEESDVITLPKFVALAGYQICLPMQIRARAFVTRSSAIKMSVNVSGYQLRVTTLIKFIVF